MHLHVNMSLDLGMHVDLGLHVGGSRRGRSPRSTSTSKELVARPQHMSCDDSTALRAGEDPLDVDLDLDLNANLVMNANLDENPTL